MLLAIDTSTAQIGLALYDGATVPGELVWQSRAHHTEQLAPALAGLLERVGVTMDSVKALGVAIGPGSFTSLRVGLAFVKGLTLARHLPLIGIPTLDIVAASVPLSDRKLAAVLQAGRGRLAVGWYKPTGSGWQAYGPATTMTAGELEKKIRKPVIVCGELTAEDRHCLARKFKNVRLASPAQCVRRPGVLAEIAWNRWQAGKTDEAASLAPIYLHVAGGLPA
ncbi:MAG: tRNA (adenosine(37)-N6)-threonylcarbamoyltransferase complex dimerization subunit type 1 TsaB [Chloroflexi bacterium]|nr:tRNA (adenosine(37)-N6)-threonylcarbamoyltransferase complex dimerization subunit type 1 TsaB [Candidatus Atribacteria bacterium]MCX6037386.1 tRNA (adenosine(37)-N6)-threonylcarbamoyltransferase complex dimerization subunit type 1 TsaB [Chloroflexota bacterium]